MELASGLAGQWGERWVNHTRLSDSQGSLSEAALQPRMLSPPPCAAEQLLWPKSSDWGTSAEAITLACVGCHWAIKHGHTAFHGLQTGTREQQESLKRGRNRVDAENSRPQRPLGTPTGLHQPSPLMFTHTQGSLTSTS